MSLQRVPRAPAPVLFIRLALHRVPELWKPYLPAHEELEPVEAAA
jgi:hypothetical protein